MYDPILQLNKDSVRGPPRVIMLGLNPSAKRSVFDVTSFGVVQMSSCESEVLSKHQVKNDIGSRKKSKC